MSVRVEHRAAVDVGKCQARNCLATQVLLIIAGPAKMVLCERCFDELRGGTAADVASLREELDDKEDKLRDAESEANHREREINRLERELEEARSELEKLGRGPQSKTDLAPLKR